MKVTTLILGTLLTGSAMLTSCGSDSEDQKTTESQSKTVSISIVNDKKTVDITTIENGKEVKKTLTGQEAEDYIKENGHEVHYSNDGSGLDIDVTTSAMESPEVKAKLDELIATIKKESNIEGKEGEQKISIKISSDENIDIEDIDIDKLIGHEDGESKTIIKKVVIETDDETKEN